MKKISTEPVTQNTEMTASRRRFLGIIGLCLLVPGGFMLWGAVTRQLSSEFSSEGLLSTERQASIAREHTESKRLLNLYHQGQDDAIIEGASTFLQKGESRGILGMRMESYFRQHEYEKAMLDYQKLFPKTDTKADNGVADNLTLLALGRQDAAYQLACQQTVETYKSSAPPPKEASRLVRVMVLRPQSLKDYQPVATWTQAAVAFARAEAGKKVEGGSPFDAMTRRSALASSLNTQALVYFREGKFDDALTANKESEKIGGDVSTWVLYVALYEKMGNSNEAKAWREKIKKQMDSTYGLAAINPQRYENLLLISEICPDILESSPA
jgi:tetratricopeptide (TPR) repeat protein